MRDTIYKPLLNPDLEKFPPTQMSERNRQILLWARDQQITIPLKYLSQEGYGQAATEQLLNEVFDAKQLQQLQGALVFKIGRNNKDVQENNSVASGGIMYSQEPIDKEGESILNNMIRRQIAKPMGLIEPNLLPPFLRKNVKGAIHVLPYGVAETTEGKEKETLLMLADDMLALIETFESSDSIGFPRFIMNGTNRTMGEAARKYFGAQVAELNSIEAFIQISAAALGGKQADPHSTVKVFVPELLKKTRIEAIGMISNRINFLSQSR